MRKCLLTAVLAAFSCALFAQEQTQATILPDGDVYVRSDKPTTVYNNERMEIVTVEGGNDFVGALSFTLPEDAKGFGAEISSVKLRLVTKRVTGGRDINIYAIPTAVTDKTVYNDLSADITTARAGEPIATLKMEGALGTDLSAVTSSTAEKYQKIDLWQNSIDLTEYVKAMSGTALNLLLSALEAKDVQRHIYTKDCSDVTNSVFTATKDELVPQLTIVYTPAPEDPSSVTKTVGPAGDVYVRSDKPTQAYNNERIEVVTVEGGNDFVGVMSFDIPQVSGSTIDKSTLRLVTKRVTGKRDVNIYALNTAVTDATVWNDVADAIATARSGEPIATFMMEGALGTDLSAVTSETATKYQTIDLWQNNIDLTDYVKSMEGTVLNLMLSAKEAANVQRHFYSKDCSDVTNAVFTAKKEELVPQLTITFKNGTTQVISAVRPTIENNVYYDLQGRRVAQPTKGLYIVNGKKVIIK